MNEPKIYRYRKHVRWMRGAIPVVLVLTAAGIGGIALLLAAHPPVSLLVLAALLLAEAAFIWVVTDRFTHTRVALDDAGIRLVTRATDTFIPYEDVEKLAFPSIRYLGGWMKVVGPDDSIRITVVLEDIAELVRHLKGGLDEHHPGEPYDESAIFNFYKTAAFSDMSWSRLYEWFPRALLILGAIVTAAMTLAAVGLMHWQWALLAVGGQIVLATLVWTIAEFYLAWRVGREADEAKFTVPGRDHSLERRVITGVLVTVAILVIATDAVAVLA